MSTSPSGRPQLALILVVAAALAAATGCGYSGETLDRVGQGDGVGVPARYATVVLDGCGPDTFQASALASPDMRRAVQEIVLLCAVPRVSGEVGPTDDSARAQIAQTAAVLQQQGYKVKLGVQFSDETAERYDGGQTASQLASPTWRTAVIASLKDLARPYDGVELVFHDLPASARGDLSLFVKALGAAVRPSKKVGIFAPPSIRSPSDVPGGDAFDLATLSQWLDRVRVMTLDYADPNSGPTIDPGWAVDAVRFAQSGSGAVPIDVAVPLYGNDVSNLGTRNVSYFEAQALAQDYHAAPGVGPTGALHLAYTDAAGRGHDLWYDDAGSTLRTLRAWGPDVLPLSVGVIYYGLGNEDPALWPALARALP
jgi:spore germination protein YaaH